MSPTATASATSGKLRPVEVALDEAAKATGAARLAQASDDATGVLEAAHAEAGRLLHEARDEGAVVGARLVSAARAGARRAAREIVLRARSDAYHLLRERVLEELARRKDTEQVSALNSHLERRAIELLGAGTIIQRDPLGIGLIGDADTRRMDASADRLVDACLAELGQTLERLWS